MNQTDQVNETKYSQDSLYEIGGPMTRARTKRMKDTLQDLILQVQDKEIALEYFITKFEGSKLHEAWLPILLWKG